MLPFPGVLKELKGVEVTDFTIVDSEEPSWVTFMDSESPLEAPLFNEAMKTLIFT